MRHTEKTPGVFKTPKTFPNVDEIYPIVAHKLPNAAALCQLGNLPGIFRHSHQTPSLFTVVSLRAISYLLSFAQTQSKSTMEGDLNPTTSGCSYRGDSSRTLSIHDEGQGQRSGLTRRKRRKLSRSRTACLQVIFTVTVPLPAAPPRKISCSREASVSLEEGKVRGVTSPPLPQLHCVRKFLPMAS